MRQHLGRFALLIFLSVALSLAQWRTACADLMFFSGTPSGFGHALSDEQTGHKNVMFQSPSSSLASLATGGVEGYIANFDTQRISITSTEPLIASGGQAPGVRAADGELTQVLFAPHDENGSDFRVFRSLSMNIDMSLNTPTTARVNVYDVSNALVGSHLFAVGQGNNFLGILGLNGQNFSRAEVITAGAMNRITQIRAGFVGSPFAEEDIAVFATPEPISWKLWLALGIGTVLAARRTGRARLPSRRPPALRS